MTTPATGKSPFDNITEQQEQDALESITKMVTGSRMLADEPGVVYALQQQKAHPADAGAIDQFMQGLDAQRIVRIAQAANRKISLTAEQKTLLSGLGTDYSGVEATPLDPIKARADQLASQGQQVKRDAQGNPVLDAQGNVQTETHPYKAKGIGRLFQTLHNDFIKPLTRDVVDPTLHGMNDAWNVVNQTLGSVATGYDATVKDLGIAGDLLDPAQAIRQIWDTADGKSVPLGIQTGKLGNDLRSAVGGTDQQLQQMQRDGYDPTNFFSILAYRAKGKAHSDLTPLINQWDREHPNTGPTGTLADLITPTSGQEAVQAAVKFTENPGGYIQAIENDSTLTPDQVKAKIQYIGSADFQALAKKVRASTSTIGNETAANIGIDPVKHSTAFALTSAGVDLAASFMLDPTLMAGKAVKIAKMSQIGIDSLMDVNGATRALRAAADFQRAQESASTVGKVANVVRSSATASLANGWQDAIDLSGKIRDAVEAGDKVQAASLTARFNASHPDMANVLDDFIGKNGVVDYVEGTKNGEPFRLPVRGDTGGIRNLDDAVAYVSGKVGMTRLMNGRAAVQESLMPGTMSAVGFRKLHGITAGWMTGRSAARSEALYADALRAFDANPALRAKALDDGDLISLLPKADDAVDAFSGTVLAHNLEEGGTTETTVSHGLASQARATDDSKVALTYQGKGKVLFNARAKGTAIGGSALGWLSPKAMAARTRLAAQRFSTMLPRNTILDADDPRTIDSIGKIAMFYMNRGDARGLQAAYAAGDDATRRTIISGLFDQMTHASGMTRSASGQKFATEARDRLHSESYSTVGDEMIVDGIPVALHGGQVRQSWLFPAFRDVQKSAAKLGLYESTFGRALTSRQADTLMGIWKMGSLFRPATVTRNMLEGWGRTALDGKLGEALKARVLQTTPNRELWERGYGLAEKPEYDRLLADAESLTGKEKAAKLAEADQLANATKLSGEYTGRSKPGEWLAHTAPMALAGRAYRRLYGRFMDETDYKMLDTISREEWSENLDGYAQQATEAAIGYARGAKDAAEVAKVGLGPTSVRRSLARAKGVNGKGGDKNAVRWTQQDTDGTLGADRFAHALSLRVNATPSVARAVLDVLEHPEEFDVQHVISALEDKKVRRLISQTAFGRAFETEGSTVASKATTLDQAELGKTQFAHKVINDYRYLLTGHNEQYQQSLADEIRATGKAPSGDWISENLRNDSRPLAVYAPETMAMPAGPINEKTLAQALLDLTGTAYQHVVERPLQRTTSSPVMWANYARTRRVAEEQWAERLKAEGLSDEAVKNTLNELSMKNAWVKTENLIDDPGQKTQFDIVARNLFPFSRATQAMIRRWGSGLWQDPTRARKMMLAYEGAVHSGFVYNNAYGEPSFVYPGSGVLDMVMREVAKIPGLEGLAHYPVASTMTGQVFMAVPGADNPFRMSMGPMASIPMREIFKLFPGDRAQLDKIDATVNGPIGVGETWTQLIPGVARKVFTAMDTNSRNSALASATTGAIANLAAAGLIPPPDAPPSVKDAFFQRIKQQVQNQLYIRAAFGMFAPAAPSAPTDGTSGSKADFAFAERGVAQLSDEYKTILNDVHGDLARANAIFTALHPDSSVWYETPRTQANASKVSLPATDTALNWMTKNQSFIGKYKSVAAYFLPQSTTNDPFNDQAYKTQLELGLRQRKTPEEFYNSVRVRDAENTFYPTVQQFDAKIAAAKSSGDSDGVQQWTQAKSDWEKQFKLLNPLFGAKIDAFGDGRATALQQIGDLKNMVASGQVPDGLGGLLSSLIQSYEGLENYVQSNKGADAASTAAKDNARQIFNNWVQANIAGTPLQDLYQGVFRVPDTNVVNLSGG